MTKPLLKPGLEEIVFPYDQDNVPNYKAGYLIGIRGELGENNTRRFNQDITFKFTSSHYCNYLELITRDDDSILYQVTNRSGTLVHLINYDSYHKFLHVVLKSRVKKDLATACLLVEKMMIEGITEDKWYPRWGLWIIKYTPKEQPIIKTSFLLGPDSSNSEEIILDLREKEIKQ